MKKVLAIVLVATMLFSFAACGKEATPATTETSNETTATTTETPSTPQTAQTTTVESAGGSDRTDLNIPLASIGNTMDANAVSAMVDYHVINNVYDGLFHINDDASLDPRVAESYTVSDDGLELTYKIRQGITFHNGDPLTAEDVVYTFTRCMENSFQTNTWSGLQTVEAIDDYTVKFTLAAANAVFPISSSKVYIVNKNVIEEQGSAYGSNNVDAGCGPYILDSYDQNTKIVLKADPNYYLGKAAIDTINYIPMADSSTQLVSFQSGQFDFCSIPAADWDGIVASGQYNTSQAPSKHCTYALINVAKEDSPLYDARVRQAIAWAIDKESICLIAADGFADVGTSMIRPGFFDGSVLHDGYYTLDVEKAKSLLAEAGYADGFSLEIQAVNASRYIKTAEVMKENLAELGIECTIVPGESSALLASWKEEKTYDIGVSGVTFAFSYNDWSHYINGTPNAQVQLDANADIDMDFIKEHLSAALAENDVTKRCEIYTELDKYILETASYIPIMNIQNLYAWAGDLQGTAPLGYYYFYEWSWK